MRTTELVHTSGMGVSKHGEGVGWGSVSMKRGLVRHLRGYLQGGWVGRLRDICKAAGCTVVRGAYMCVYSMRFNGVLLQG